MLNRIIKRDPFYPLLAIFALAITSAPVGAASKEKAAPKAPETLAIIAYDPHNSLDGLLKEKLIKRASAGELIVGLEGVVRDERDEKLYAEDTLKAPKGLLFGIEDGFANALTNIVLNCAYFAAEDFENIGLAKAQLIYDLKENARFQTIWAKLEAAALTEETKALVKKLEAFMSAQSGASAEEAVVRFAKSIGEFKGNIAWMELMQKIAYLMSEEAAKLPLANKPDMKKIKMHIENPQEESPAKYMQEFLRATRNLQAVERITEIAEIARKRNQGAFIPLKKGVAEETAKALGKERAGLRVKLYPDFAAAQKELNF